MRAALRLCRRNRSVPTIALGDRSAAGLAFAHGDGNVGGNAAPLDVNRKIYLAVSRNDRYMHPKGMPLTG